jgi:hypothetical protein
VLLRTLLELGQLAWLRTPFTQRALLAIVIHDVICEVKRKSTWSPHQLENFAEFILGATGQPTLTRECLLDKTEFLVECVVPLLERIALHGGSLFLKPIATVLVRLYETSSPGQAQCHQWLHHKVHATVLLLLLDLADLQRPRFSKGNMGTRGGGQQFDDISRLCELIVLVLTEQVQSISSAYPSHLVRPLWVALHHLQDSDDVLDKASRLVTLPLLRACSQHMSVVEWKPKLDSRVFRICGDKLEICQVSVMEEMEMDESRATEPALAQAMLLLLHYASLCDDVADDFIQVKRNVHLPVTGAPC